MSDYSEMTRAGSGNGGGEAGFEEAPYGGYDLTVGDRDQGFIYGGKARSADNGDVVPDAANNGFVKELQQDLVTTGFLLVGTPDGVYGRWTARAVREFQSCAKMERTAQEDVFNPDPPSRYVERLTSVPNPALYAGFVSGVANQETRAALKAWVQHFLRCPVIVEAWKMVGGQPDSVVKTNLWRASDLEDTGPRMYATDFSRYYTLPSEHDTEALEPLGDYQTFETANFVWEGPRSAPPKHTWAEGEMLPEGLVGKSLAELGTEDLSCFKVIRAVAERECLGFFDSINSYDNAAVSLGPCHWTLCILSDAALSVLSNGELTPYFAYLQHADPAQFTKALGFFGIKASHEWVDVNNKPTGKTMFDTSQRKYLSWIALQEEDGTFTEAPRNEDEAEYFRNWHWFYRFAMAGRTVEGFRRRMWDMARIRLRDVLELEWGDDVKDIPVSGSGTRKATIGDVYTSEQAISVLLRWHIRKPAHMVKDGIVGDHLQSAFDRTAGIPHDKPPTEWNTIHEKALIAGLLAEVDTVTSPSDLAPQMHRLVTWPDWDPQHNPLGFRLPLSIGKLSDARNSFHIKIDDLPDRPY